MKTLLTIAVLAFCGCETEKTLDDAAFSGVILTGPNRDLCTMEEPVGDGFKAIDPFGNQVYGCVCTDWNGNVAIRYHYF